MKITIDVDASVPLFTQLIEQVKQAVLDGKLTPGDALPSIRQLAGDLDVNHKTVAKAYRLLERDHVIQTKGYRGTFVHPQAKNNSAIDLSAQITSELSKTIEVLKDTGATDSEIRIAFGELMNKRGN